MAIDRATFELIWGNGHSFERQFTPQGAHEVTRWELCVPHWYEDGFWKSGPKKGQIKWSIGFGHQEGGENWPFSYDANPTLALSRQQAEQVFRKDAEAKARFVRARLDTSPDLWITSRMFDALVSLVFNSGEGNVDEGRVLKLFNERRYTAAIAAFYDHRFAWEYKKDAAGNRIPDPNKPGDFIKERVEKNGLITRRMSEGGICMTKIERT